MGGSRHQLDIYGCIRDVADILGPPGSGVDWFRYILEQLTGLHTGSTHLKHPDLFAGEGRADEVEYNFYFCQSVLCFHHSICVCVFIRIMDR